MKCTKCHEGKLEVRTVPRHEVGDLLGLPAVLVNAPLLQCTNCGAVHVPGALLDALIPQLAAKVVTVPELMANEAKFLRKVIGLTQSELADRLDLSRPTVARWEADNFRLAGTNSFALRALVAMRLIDDEPSLGGEVASRFNRPETTTAAMRPYQLASPSAECHA